MSTQVCLVSILLSENFSCFKKEFDNSVGYGSRWNKCIPIKEKIITSLHPQRRTKTLSLFFPEKKDTQNKTILITFLILVSRPVTEYLRFIPKQTSIYKLTVSEAKGLRVHRHIDLISDDGHMD